MPSLLYPKEVPQYPVNRIMGGPQSSSNFFLRRKKSLALPELDIFNFVRFLWQKGKVRLKDDSIMGYIQLLRKTP
jgi:hypothetical protein